MEAHPKSRLGADHAISAVRVGAAAFLALSAADRARIWHGHYTPYGNGVVAKLIATRLRALGGP